MIPAVIGLGGLAAVGAVVGGFAGLDDAQAVFLDIVVKAVVGLTAVLGAWLTASKYLAEREKEATASLIEARRPFMTKRQEVYYELVQTASTISNRGMDDPIRREAAMRFWDLYWGAVPLVADREVSVAVDEFEIAYSFRPEDGVGLRNASMQLARACRNSLGFDGPAIGELPSAGKTQPEP